MHFGLWVRVLQHLTPWVVKLAKEPPLKKCMTKLLFTMEQLRLFPEECLSLLLDVQPVFHGQRLCFLFRNPSLTWWGLPFAYWHPVPTDSSQSARRPSRGTPAHPRTSSWSRSRSSSVRTTSPRPPNSWSPSPPKRTTTEPAECWPYYFLGFSKSGYKLRLELFWFLPETNV